jgi:hypothetical protein
MKEIYLTSEAERRYRKSYYERNRESILQKIRERYAQDPERKRDKNKQYSMTHDRSEYFRQYYRSKKEGNISI